jgi:hypothetical protein
MRSFGMPPGASASSWNTRFESHMTRKALKGSGIECPKLETYAHRLWYCWKRSSTRHNRRQSLEGNVRGKLVIITGGALASAAARCGWPVRERIVIAGHAGKLEARRRRSRPRAASATSTWPTWPTCRPATPSSTR